MEDVWWCPKCGKEHRTTDGGMFGQMYKMWREATENDFLESETIHHFDGSLEMREGSTRTIYIDGYYSSGF